MVSREHPLITVNAMVTVGPWTIGPIHYGPPRKCDRCGTTHNYVWVCTIRDEVDDATVAAKLLGRRVWEVGSKCGPTLEMVSDAKWSAPPKDLGKMIKLAVKAVHVLADAVSGGAGPVSALDRGKARHASAGRAVSPPAASAR